VIAWTVSGGFTVWKNHRLNRWRERKNPMKKIVILSNSLGGSYSWITLLNALFPECEIEIRTVFPDEEGLRSFPFGSLSKNSITDEFAPFGRQVFKDNFSKLNDQRICVSFIGQKADQITSN
jgi:hypothetical protein